MTIFIMGYTKPVSVLKRRFKGNGAVHVIGDSPTPEIKEKDSVIVLFDNKEWLSRLFFYVGETALKQRAKLIVLGDLDEREPLKRIADEVIKCDSFTEENLMKIEISIK